MTKTNINQYSRFVNDKSNGFTLVELMVSIALGILLTAAVIQTYLSTKQTYRVTEGVSRVQENARFSLHFLSEDLRYAGNSECISKVRNRLKGEAAIGNIDEYISHIAPVKGWEFTGTATDSTIDFVLNDPDTEPQLTSAISSWVRTPTTIGTAEPIPVFLENEVVKGSDILWFKRYEKLDVTLDTANNTDINSQYLYINEADTIVRRSILLVGDCSQAELFQVRNIGNNARSLWARNNGASPGNTTPAATLAFWGKLYGDQHNLYAYVQTFYYIGKGASGLPSLFRYQTSVANDAEVATWGDFTNTTEELIEGVETMQVLYGEDTSGDDNPNTYVSANQVVDWGNVVSTRIGLLLRSPNNASGKEQSASHTLLDSIDFTHPTTDSLLRYSINTTIKLRNRGLNDNVQYHVCNAPTTNSNTSLVNCAL